MGVPGAGTVVSDSLGYLHAAHSLLRVQARGSPSLASPLGRSGLAPVSLGARHPGAHTVLANRPDTGS